MKKLYLVLVVGVCMILFPIFASAEGFTISVKPEIPDNQKDTSQTMYNIQMAPNEEKEYVLHVTNDGEEERKVAIMMTDATTLPDGTIDMSNPQVKLIKKAKNKLSELASLQQDTLVIPAKSTKDATFTIKTPKEEMPGIILGAIYVLDKNEKGNSKDNEKAGMSIRNQMGYTTEVMLSLSDQQVKAKLALDKLKVGTYMGHPSLEIPIQNINPNIVPNVTVKTEIKKVGASEILVTDTKKNNQLAPQAFFPHQVKLSEDKIKNGTYTALIKADSDYGHWEWQREFKITKHQAKDINQRTEQGVNKLPWWVYVLIIIGLILVILVSYLIYNVRKKNDNKK